MVVTERLIMKGKIERYFYAWVWRDKVALCSKSNIFTEDSGILCVSRIRVNKNWLVSAGMTLAKLLYRLSTEQLCFWCCFESVFRASIIVRCRDWSRSVSEDDRALVGLRATETIQERRQPEHGKHSWERGVCKNYIFLWDTIQGIILRFSLAKFLVYHLCNTGTGNDL